MGTGQEAWAGQELVVKNSPKIYVNLLKIAVMTRVPREVPSLTCPYSPNHEVAPLRA